MVGAKAMDLREKKEKHDGIMEDARTRDLSMFELQRGIVPKTWQSDLI
jgi:hypothetical protein